MCLSNVCTPSGVVNGMRGIAIHAVPDPTGKSLLSIFTWFLQYIAQFSHTDDPSIICDSPPLFVLVRHNRINTSAFTSLKCDITPLFPIERRSDVKGVSFTRLQIPFTPGFAITNYKSQGDTFESAILDLKLTSAKTAASLPKISLKNYASMNIQLRKIKSLVGPWLRESITISDIQSKPDPALQVKVQRLAILEQRTIERWWWSSAYE